MDCLNSSYQSCIFLEDLSLRLNWDKNLNCAIKDTIYGQVLK